MGQHSICESILEGPWRLRPGVLPAVIPASELFTTGVCHLKLPPDLVSAYSAGGDAVEWLDRADDGELLALGEDHWIKRYLMDTFPGAEMNQPYQRRIEWEANNWHFDISPGLTDGSNYHIQATVGPLERAHRKCQSFFCTVPFPVDFQGGTVTVPWAGEHAGRPVQAPLGYATIFDPHACWHRGDKWLGSRRGLLMQGITRMPATVSD